MFSLNLNQVLHPFFFFFIIISHHFSLCKSVHHLISACKVNVCVQMSVCVYLLIWFGYFFLHHLVFFQCVFFSSCIIILYIYIYNYLTMYSIYHILYSVSGYLNFSFKYFFVLNPQSLRSPPRLWAQEVLFGAAVVAARPAVRSTANGRVQRQSMPPPPQQLQQRRSELEKPEAAVVTMHDTYDDDDDDGDTDCCRRRIGSSPPPGIVT